MTAQSTSISINSDINTATEQAYASLVESGLPAGEVHRLAVCTEIGIKTVGHLLTQGYDAKLEIRQAEWVGQHSFIALFTRDGEEILADPTWQQFLPIIKRHEGLPKVLVGSRSDIIAQAKDYGVGEPALSLWHYDGPPMSQEEHQEADRAATIAAEEAAEKGEWERFASR